MKIWFTMKTGQRIEFSKLTGLNPQAFNHESASRLAEAAMNVDDRIESYDIEEEV